MDYVVYYTKTFNFVLNIPSISTFFKLVYIKFTYTIITHFANDLNNAMSWPQYEILNAYQQILHLSS